MPEESPLSALDTTLLESAVVVSNQALSCSTLWELVLRVPHCAALVKPGQFVHLAMPEQRAHTLRRPFSVYQALAQKGTITMLYQVVGAGTKRLQQLNPEEELSCLGPIGRGWNSSGAERCLLIGGGVGAATLFLLAEELQSQNRQVDVILGAQTAEQLVCKDQFVELLGAQRVQVTTDDGSAGYRGYTSHLAQELLAQHPYDYVATCGPEPMQKAVAALASESDVRCEVSLERRMACGIGACLSCVVDTSQGKRRACVDGPVFDAREVWA